MATNPILKLWRVALVAAALLVCVAAQSAYAQHARADADLLVTTDWLSAHLKDPGLSILHVGVDRKSYDTGHIPGARFVALSQLVVTRDGTPNELPPATDLTARFTELGVGASGRVILYGDQKGLYAARAFFTLDYLGQGDRAALLDGGLDKWRAEGRPISTEESPTAARPFEPGLRPEVIAMLPAVRDVSWLLTSRPSGGWALLDARPDAQFSASQPEADLRPGHIPGAASLFWQRTFVPGESPVLRSEPELRALFSEAGVKPNAQIVTYCKTGVQASFLYFVARYLGMPVRMYDGSFVEWSGHPDLPVATGKP